MCPNGSPVRLMCSQPSGDKWAISQDPASGSSVTEGSPVNVMISSGPQMVTVPVTLPNVEGLTQAAATTTIIAAKLTVGTGTATGKDPARGSSVAQGSSVNLGISLGPQMVIVPNVEGLTRAAATAANLTVGVITQQTSNTVASDNVVSQDQPSGFSVA
jgi:beta-lactam-binding protein with PASTA domain